MASFCSGLEGLALLLLDAAIVAVPAACMAASVSTYQCATMGAASRATEKASANFVNTVVPALFAPCVPSGPL